MGLTGILGLCSLQQSARMVHALGRCSNYFGWSMRSWGQAQGTRCLMGNTVALLNCFADVSWR